jgi:FAD dependent oxidoreductase
MRAKVEVEEAHRKTPVVAETDVIVVGGGPAGVAAAVAAARNGATVILLERYNHLGGLASGGMVLVLDDMTNGQEITVTGIAQEYVERLGRLGLAVYPPPEDRRRSIETWNRWRRWGLYDFHVSGTPKPVTYAVTFDPDGWKRVSDDLVRDVSVNLRLHSWFSAPITEDNRIRGVICETKNGREAILGDVVIDTTGDMDVAARAGSPHITSSYIMTLVFRLGGVDCDAAERFETQHQRDARALNREAKRILGGAWELWWLRTPLPGVVWCNCPHLTGFDGTRVADLTRFEFEARQRIDALTSFARSKLPGFDGCYLIDVAAQTGVRQTRLLQGEYVVTKDDIRDRRHFPDSIARGRDYYTPYRALLPRGVEQLLVAGRHYSATPAAQRISREIPPCIAMGEAAGVAASISLESNLPVRNIDVRALQRRLRVQGADPGDVPSANATIDTPVTRQAGTQETPASSDCLYLPEVKILEVKK